MISRSAFTFSVLLFLSFSLINAQEVKINNNFVIESDGTPRLDNSATVFDDLRFDALSIKLSGSSGIAVNLTENTVDFATGADINDYLIASPQMPHALKFQTKIYPHIHFFQAMNAVPNFAIQYRWQSNSLSKTTAWTALKCNTAVFTYTGGTILQIATTTDGITPPVDQKISDICQFRVIRDTKNGLGLSFGADPYNATAGVLSFDCHFEIDTQGSRTQYAK